MKPRSRVFDRVLVPASLLGLCLAASACGSSDDDNSSTNGTGGGGTGAAPGSGATGGGGGSATGGGASDGYNPCTPETRLGAFEIVLGETETSVSGRIKTGVIPNTVPESVTSNGDCSIIQTRTLFCADACASPLTCGLDGTCVDNPSDTDMGTVSIDGLVEPLEMTAAAPLYYYRNPVVLPHPGFQPGADIQLAATGGAYTAFGLRGWGIEPLLVSDPQVTVESGQPVSLSWTPPTVDIPARLHLVLNLATHGGGSPARIECEAPDIGSFTIPADLVTQLMSMGYSGFPQLTMTRRTADSTLLAPGCVELLVSSTCVLAVEIPGLVSCDTDADCTTGQTCQADFTCS